VNDLIVVDADPRWPEQFAAIADALLPIVDGVALRIEHVGSTAVPGLAAKPIIDIDVVVATDDDVGPAIALIESAGYEWVGNLTVEGREAFEPPSGSSFVTHHLYLVVENNRAHCDHWLLRDALIAAPDVRDQYGELKRANVARSGGDADRYVALKASFVARVLARAREERSMEPVPYWDPDLS
jgi:GrpB-like predicted nucleotidyltransferase (UPF0157 family)